jgi:hypothetical protein
LLFSFPQHKNPEVVDTLRFGCGCENFPDLMKNLALLGLLVPVFVSASDDSGPPCSSGAFACQVHLAFGDEPGLLRVSWVSGGDSSTEAPVVEWGLVGSNPPFPNTVNALVSETYSLDDMCDPKYVDLPVLRGWEDPGRIHHAELTLNPYEPILFRVGDAVLSKYSNVSGPVQFGPKRGGGLTSIALSGDMGTYAYAPAAAPPGAVDDVVALSLARAAPSLDAMVLVGDLAYAHDGVILIFSDTFHKRYV